MLKKVKYLGSVVEELLESHRAGKGIASNWKDELEEDFNSRKTDSRRS